MAPVYKLTYFNVTALAEPIRFLLSYGSIEFEDIRFDHDAWPQHKKSMPFGQVPVLEINGKPYTQSIALSRYVAKLVKLVGKDDLEDLEIDGIVDTLNDLRIKLRNYHFEPDAKIKKSLKEPLFNETIPYYLERVENIAKKNNGYLAVGRLTWADLWFIAMLKYLNFIYGGDLIGKYPTLKALEATVLELPNIKSYIKRRPETES